MILPDLDRDLVATRWLIDRGMDWRGATRPPIDPGLDRRPATRWQIDPIIECRPATRWPIEACVENRSATGPNANRRVRNHGSSGLEPLWRGGFQTYWDNDRPVGEDDPVQQAAHVNWLNSMYTATYADYGGFPDPRRNPPGCVQVDGTYFNYPDVALGTNESQEPENPGIDFAMYLYFKENWCEKAVPFDPANPASYNLQDIKRRWNLGDWFRSAQSVPV